VDSKVGTGGRVDCGSNVAVGSGVSVGGPGVGVGCWGIGVSLAGEGGESVTASGVLEVGRQPSILRPTNSDRTVNKRAFLPGFCMRHLSPTGWRSGSNWQRPGFLVNSDRKCIIHNSGDSQVRDMQRMF
jgi:hypothetical protein